MTPERQKEIDEIVAADKKRREQLALDKECNRLERLANVLHDLSVNADEQSLTQLCKWASDDFEQPI